jgi:hypothetical protein
MQEEDRQKRSRFRLLQDQVEGIPLPMTDSGGGYSTKRSSFRPKWTPRRRIDWCIVAFYIAGGLLVAITLLALAGIALLKLSDISRLGRLPQIAGFSTPS